MTNDKSGKCYSIKNDKTGKLLFGPYNYNTENGVH